MEHVMLWNINPTIFRGMWIKKKKPQQSLNLNKVKYAENELNTGQYTFLFLFVDLKSTWDNWEEKKDLLRLDVYCQHEARFILNPKWKPCSNSFEQHNISSSGTYDTVTRWGRWDNCTHLFQLNQQKRMCWDDGKGERRRLFAGGGVQRALTLNPRVH